MKRYRLVDELYLDWIFSCINRGKIYNMVGGSVTHTNYPLDNTTIEIICSNTPIFLQGWTKKTTDPTNRARVL